MKRILCIILCFFISLSVIACQKEEVCNIVDGCPNELVATLEGYEFYRVSVGCQMVAGEIVIDGYDFGYFHSACGHTLDDIGYYVRIGEDIYVIQALVDDGILKTKDIYNIYQCDPFKLGEYIT